MHITPLTAWSSFTTYRHLKHLLQTVKNFDDFTSCPQHERELQQYCNKPKWHHSSQRNSLSDWLRQSLDSIQKLLPQQHKPLLASCFRHMRDWQVLQTHQSVSLSDLNMRQMFLDRIILRIQHDCNIKARSILELNFS